jgi:DNA (cytosine-5)-methyltransferase 1
VQPPDFPRKVADVGEPLPTVGPGRVAELFAGVGGFRLGLEGHPDSPDHASQWQVVWSNQWEPSTRKQHASDCYVERFGPDGHACEDIAKVLDRDIAGLDAGLSLGTPVLPDDLDLVVGGFPCQDYSVAKPLSQANGIEGRKGVLWWQIHRLLDAKRPPFVLLENVDRLLKSPSTQRGRDFAIMLASFSRLGYRVEWRVVNAADYGFPQRRRRVFIYAERSDSPAPDITSGRELATSSGVLAEALPCQLVADRDDDLIGLDDDLYDLSLTFGRGLKRSPWGNAGVMSDGLAWTGDVVATSSTEPVFLGDILIPEEDVPAEFFIPAHRLGARTSPARGTWRYLKGAKREPRVDRRTGHHYFYSEGALTFPDRLDRPSRTVLTGEGGTGPSRFKHVVQQEPGGGYRRLTPVELERLNGFPDGWTEGMTDGRRAFCMGNALVIGLVEAIGHSVARRRAELLGRANLRRVG